MPGHHTVVYSAFMPTQEDGVTIPGYLYFQSTGAHAAPAYEVYTSSGPGRYPAAKASFLGTVGAMNVLLPYRPLSYEVCFYFRNFAGSVDCYLWRPTHAPDVYLLYRVLDISDPNDWYIGSRYEFQGVVGGVEPMSASQRRRGLRRFYRVMRPAV